jgi:Fatty acid hydroxylase
VLGLAVAALAVAAFALARVTDLRPWQLAFVPLFLVAGNAVEWHAHRGVLHRRVRFLEALYVRHTPQHHALYVAGQMAIQSLREVRFVLLPGYGLLAILAATSPVVLGFLWLRQPNLAALWVASVAVYVLAYEWLHLAYHLPDSSPISRLRLVQRLRRHHELHHAPQLMQRWNLNVTVPLWDHLHGTAFQVRPAGAGAFQGAPGAAVPRRAP